MSHGLTAPLLGAMMRSRLVRDLIARLVAYVIAALLLAIAFAFLIATLYLGLAEAVEPPLAALLTALVLGGLAALILLAARYRRPRRVPAGAVGIDALLLSASEQVRRDPWSTLAIAAVLGALAEITHSATSRPPR